MKVINDLDMTHTHWKEIVSNDLMRPVMTGVYFDLENETMVGTNSHIMLEIPCSIDWTEDKLESMECYTRRNIQKEMCAKYSKIVPVEFFDKRKYMGNYKDYSGQIKYDFSDENYAQVWHFSEVVFRCRYIEGKFPNYRAVIPQQDEQELENISLSLDFLLKIYKSLPLTPSFKNLNFTMIAKNRPVKFECVSNPRIKGIIMPVIGG